MKPAEMEFLERLRGAEAVKPTAPVEESVQKEFEPDTSTPLTLRNLFTHHSVHPVVLDFALLRQFGVEWYGWLPVTLWTEIARIFKTDISELTKAKILTTQTLHVSSLPWTSWFVFEKMIQGLNNNIPNWKLMQAPTLEQLYSGVDVINTIRREDFAEEVASYIAAAALNEDVFFVPPPLDFVQTEITQPKWRCKDCGNTYLALNHDGACDFCTGKYLPERGLSLTPDLDALSAGKGKNLELILTYNPDEAQKLWEELKNKAISDVDPPVTQAGVMVAKLLMARDYMNLRRRQMAEQLISLKSWLETS